ncbi:hypothetical protein [Carnobacterium pleistocenium]|uniref:hypothetical protein n=1 Tax=Carnobacterium pleistocenium TaxID=181073 RepID=UPI00054D3939|nr:hypothetical protein [Carnobacterium pleistocenium]
MKIKNSELNSVITFLDGIKLIGEASIGRTKLKDGLSFLNEAYGKDQTITIDEFDQWADESKTSFKTTNDKLMKAINKLNNKEVTINIDDVLFIDDLKKALDDYKGELEGKNADAYAMLVLEFKENESKKEEVK